MSTGRRFTADTERKEPRFTPDQLNELARVIERDYSNMGNVYWALRQAAETESQVMGLVELVKAAYEEGVRDGSQEAITGERGHGDYFAEWEKSEAREALSKFRGE